MLYNLLELIIIMIKTYCLYHYLSNKYTKIINDTKIWFGLFYLLILFLNFTSFFDLYKVLFEVLFVSLLIKSIYFINDFDYLANIFAYTLILELAKIISNLVHKIYSENNNLLIYITKITVNLIVIISLLVLNNVNIKHSDIEFKKKDIFILFFPLFFELATIIFFISYIIDHRFSYDYTIYIVVIILLIVLLVCNILLTENYLINRIKVIELENLNMQKENQLKYSEAKSNIETDIRILHHDLKNYIISFSDSKKINKRLFSLNHRLQKYDSYFSTNNNILDVIINKKYLEAKLKNINLECLIDFTKGDFIDTVDICSIFGNLLDNAIESCEKVISGQRYIIVKANIIECFLVIKITNTHTNDILISNNRVLTSKKDKKNHGLGLISIRESLKKYNGEMSIINNEKEFTVNILIPLPLDN